MNVSRPDRDAAVNALMQRKSPQWMRELLPPRVRGAA